MKPLDIIEIAGMAAAVALAFAAPRAGRRLLSRIGALADRIAARRALVIAGAGVLSFAGSALVSLLVHLPEPGVHDEFGYLLLADTFAEGRTTNPQHPHWQHFETFHVIHEPTYMSKFPPAPGLVLAAGQVLAGDPLVGVWLAAGFSCAGVAWMAYGWLPPRWAVLAALLAFLRFGVFGWPQSYWGGSLAVAGGALVFGAVRRLFDRPRPLEAILLGAGLAVLANTRPYEGFVAALPVAVLVATRAFRREWLLAATAPLVLTLAAAGGLMLAYNKAGTGRATLMPYQLYQNRYAVASPWIWNRPSTPHTYNHFEMRRFHEAWEWSDGMRQRDASGVLAQTPFKLKQIHQYPLRFLLFLPILLAPWLVRRRWPRFALATCATLFVGLLCLTWVQPHYVAPVIPLLLVLCVEALRHLRLWRPAGRPAGRLLAAAVPFVCAVGFVASFAAPPGNPWGTIRATIQQQIEEAPGDHLVVVTYGPRHAVHFEWVHNRADIDGARVVWARDMGTEPNAALLEHFAGRTAWRLRVDADNELPRLEPFK